MKCLNDEELTDHLAGEETPAGKTEAQEHLRNCQACRNKMTALNSAASAAAKVPPAPVSADFTARLMARINSEKAAAARQENPRTFNWFTSGRLAFAACALAILAGAFFHLGDGDPAAPAGGTLYLTDGPATPVWLAAATACGAGPGTEPGGIHYADACGTANCGL